LLLIGITFVLNTLSFIFNYFQQKFSAVIIGNVVFDLRKDVNQAVLNHDMSFFDKYPTGKIVSRINTDSRDFGRTASQIMQASSSFLFVFLVFIIMASINLILTLVVVAMIPFIFLVAFSFRKIARSLTLKGQRALANVNSFVQESFSGIQIAKTFRQEDKLYERFKTVNQQSYEVNLKRAYAFNLIFPTLSIIQGVAMSLIILGGGWAILEGYIQAGDFYLFIQSLQLFFFPLFTIASFWPSFQAGLGASERIFALIDAPPIVKQENAIKPDEIEGKVEFRDLDFSYIERQEIFQSVDNDKLQDSVSNKLENNDHKRTHVFKDFNLLIPPGESLAIVGHTGAGKSSLAKLLTRLYEFQCGDILIDGTSIRKFDLQAYRKHVGIIQQTPFLWNDTLENNVKYGSPNATEGQIMQALQKAGGSDWIEDLPQGLQTNIRERGSLLSMGQRQLVALARLILENPSILVLDEATASVDPFTETRIQKALEKTIEGRTSIIIAHRLTTVRKVDRIIVLEEGKIVEEGNHQELMEKGEVYANLYNTYFRHQSLEYIEKTKEIVKEVKANR